VARALACNERQPIATRLHELPGLLVLDKPAGQYVEAVAESQGGAPAHRLDRDTSGVLLVAAGAAQKAVLARLSALFARPGAIRKAYVGAVAAVPPDWPPSATVLSGHGRSAGGLWRAYSHEDVGRPLPSKRVREARTQLTFFASALPAGGPSLVLAEPRQGRTHQVRIHAALAGAALLGDVRYGGLLRSQEGEEPALGGVLLHAVRLQLPEGALEAGAPRMTFAAPLPEWVLQAGEEAVSALLAALEAWEAGEEGEHAKCVVAF